jgi:ferrochelatase
MAEHYDALLVLSFGGPEKPEDVMPFLENVTRGRGVPRERLLEVAAHYHHFGGKSPINDQNRALVAALRAELDAHGPKLPVFWGNRNWAPYLADTLREMRDLGVRRALGYVTSAFGSYSGCRQYLDDVARARGEVGEGAPEVVLLRKFFNHPGFIESNVAHARAALARLPDRVRASARLVFTAHSVPLSMARTSPYETQLREAARLVAEGVGRDEFDLVWQSRSGPPEVPWLEPDVREHLRALHAAGATAVVVSPLGFVSDHMEVVYDLDYEAKQVADEVGLAFARAATPGVHPRFVTMIRELVNERVAASEKRSLGVLPPAPDVCADTCCPRPERKLAGAGELSKNRP